MIYRLHTKKDTFLSSEPNVAGLYRVAGTDPILEVSQYPDINDVTRYKSTLIEFETADINTALAIAGTNTYSASLNLYVAEAAELPISFSLGVTAISESWRSGVGMFDDVPIRNSGATWVNKNSNETWATPGAPTHAAYYNSQSFINTDDFDVNINVTDIVTAISSSTIYNDGFKVDLEKSGQVLTSTSQSISLKYYGGKSHTIFKPFLQLEWDDSSFITGSNSVIADTLVPIKVHTKNLQSTYKQDGKKRFRLTARPIFESTSFVTSSIKTNYALPEDSYFSIRDTYTNEPIVDYSIGTKVSCDSNGSFFDLYTNALRTNRFYYIEIKTSIDSSTLYFRDDKSFKVIK